MHAGTSVRPIVISICLRKADCGLARLAWDRAWAWARAFAERAMVQGPTVLDHHHNMNFSHIEAKAWANHAAGARVIYIEPELPEAAMTMLLEHGLRHGGTVLSLLPLAAAEKPNSRLELVSKELLPHGLGLATGDMELLPKSLAASR